MKKRLLSALLALCMVLAMLPVPAFAAESSASAKGGDATFTLSANSYSCADGHTGELGSIQVTGVDISQWKSNKKITIRYDVRYRCTEPSCALYNSGDSFFSYSGEHTFTDTNVEFCHKKVSETFLETITTALESGGSKKFSVSFALTSDKGISEAVLHEQNVDPCTKDYYSVRCWECTGCGYYFMQADMSGTKLTLDQVFFPPAGHKLTNVPAKDPTCIAKGTVAHWHCERCGLNFSDEQGTSELTTIETDEPFAAHQYDANGVCTVCGAKAAAGVRTDTGMVWYDTMAGALAALTPGAQLTVNGDYAGTIALDKTCTVTVKAGVTVSAIQVSDAENCVVTVSNDGSIGSLTGYTGKVTLRSGSGVYGSIVNGTSGGTVGGFLSRNACYKTADGQWLHPDQATGSSIQNVTVAYVPLASLTISGENVTGGDGSYALTAQSGENVTLTAAAANMDGGSSENAAYIWYYENDPDTLLSQAAELTLKNVSAGTRTIVCKAAVDGYTLTAKLALTVTGTKASQTITLKLSKTSVGIREKVLPFLSAEGVQEEAAVTYYRMLGETPDPENDAVIGEDFAFAESGEYKIYAYTAETDNYAATASKPVSITVTAHANHCYCGGTFNHTHEDNAEWQAWDGKSAISYEWKWIPISGTGELAFKVAYVYLTGNVSTNLTLEPRQILYLCLNGYSFTCADPSQPAITLAGEKGWPAELDLCDCAGTGTLGGSNADGGSIRIGAYANATLYGGTLTGNSTTENGGAVSIGGNGSFTMQGGAITGNSAANGGGIYATAGSVTINGGVISDNHAANGGGIYAASGAQFHLNGGGIQNNVATEAGGGVYCGNLYSQNNGRCEFYGGTISGNTAQRGGGAYVSVCYIGYRNCRTTGNTATEAGGGLYLVPYASEKIIYMGNVYGSGGTIAPYIYDNTVNSAQNNLYLSDPDTQIQFTARIDTGAKIGVYFTGITRNGASVLLNSLQVSTESLAEQYRQRIFCDNPYYGRLEARKNGSYYGLYLLSDTYVEEYTVTVVAEGNGIASASPGRAPEGTEITLTAAPAEGSHFSGWRTDPETVVNGSKFTMPAGNVTVTAIFEVHSFTEEAAEERYLVSPADCDHDAVYYKSCVCGEKGTETFAKTNSALDHDWSPWTSNGNGTHSRVCKRNAAHTETENCTGGAATCTAKAVCQVCGGEYGELAAHAFTAEVTEERYLKSAATCTEKAVYYKSCAVCGLSSEGTAGEATFESGSLLDHHWGAPNYTWTQVPDGYMCAATKECTKCGYDVSEIASVAYAVTKEPTCLDAGTGTYTATFSDAFGFTTQTKDAAIPAAGHSWGAAEYTWAQTETGYTCTAKRVCRKDETHTETETVAAEYTVVTEPTCLTAGLGRCRASFEADWAEDASQDVPIPAAGHDWGNWTQDSDGKTHTRVCKRDGEHTETGNCAGGTATCMAKAVCETCKAEYGEKDPDNHAAGCVPQWTITEAEHSQKYSRCGKVTVAKAPHAFGPWTTTQEPAPEQTGEKEHTCEVCEYKQTEIIPATGYAYYTIRATAYTGGSISPSGDVSVREGLDRTFTITPNRGYSVSNIKIDGVNVGTARSYTFENVSGNHTIEVSFQKTTGSPQTGDGINLPLLCVLLTVSTLGLAGIALFRRKRTK